ncbi:MAG: VOC family protein [Verrucomicrobia bacterium]|nr:VOC family protein [Verrucomicrobiota bacterium]
MKKSVDPIPKAFHSITPYLIVRGAAEAIAFYQRAFGATERFRMSAPDGKTVGHAEIMLGDSIVMLADEMPAHGFSSPLSLKGTPVSLLFYVPDVDAAFARAVAAGAKVLQPVEDKFYGERSGCLTDPFGHQWTLMTHIEDVPPEELNRRAAAFFAEMAAAEKAKG